MVSDAKKAAMARYAKKSTKSLCLKLVRTTDADIIKKLESVGNVQGYIKSLIRKDIAESES